MLVPIVIAFQIFAAPTDRTRAAETAEMALKQRIQEQERDAAAREALRRRFFEQKFNRLVDAVAEFAKEYKGGKGSVWLAVRANQFLISRIDARNGASGLVPLSLEGAVVSNDFPAFIINSNRLARPSQIGSHFLHATRSTPEFDALEDLDETSRGIQLPRSNT